VQAGGLGMLPRRRGGRVAEGGGLLNRCTGSTRTVSSNLIPSASFLRLTCPAAPRSCWRTVRTRSAACQNSAGTNTSRVSGRLRGSYRQFASSARCKPARTTAAHRPCAAQTVSHCCPRLHARDVSAAQWPRDATAPRRPPPSARCQSGGKNFGSPSASSNCIENCTPTAQAYCTADRAPRRTDPGPGATYRRCMASSAAPGPV
jgi:hypothetical protein